MIEQSGRGARAPRRDGQPAQPAGDRGTDRRDVHRRRRERHQDRQWVARVGEWRGPGCRLRSRQTQIGGHGTNRVSHLIQNGVGVGLTLEFDHKPAKCALDMGGGHSGNSPNRFLDHRRMLVPAGEWQQWIQVQMHSPPALPAHRWRRAVRGAVGRSAHADRTARRVGHRLNHRARQLRYRAGEHLHRARGAGRSGDAGSHYLRGSAGHASDDAGYARNLHSVTLQLRLPRLMILACQGPVHRWAGWTAGR